MNSIDIVCLMFILAGVFFIVMSFVHRHKGMWNLGSDDYAEPWDLTNPKVPPTHRHGIETPYDETQLGIALIILGLICFVYSTWGLKISAAAVTAASMVSLVFNGVRLKRLDGEHELRTWCIANLIISGFALFFGALTFFLV